jgi:hypothetical protein
MRAVLFLGMLAATMLPATAGAAPTNAEKAAAKRISTHIQQSGQMRNYRIGVTYKEGVATLEGTVASTEQREKAIRLAREVKGVKKVQCKLQCPEEANSKAVDETTNAAKSEELSKGSEPQKSESTPNIEPEFGPVRPADNAMPAPPQPQQQVRQASARQQAPMARRINRPMQRPRAMPRRNMPLPQRRIADPSIRQTSAFGVQQAGGPYAYGAAGVGMMGPQAMPAGYVPSGSARGVSYENAQMPGYSWPSYAAYPNYAALSYPQQYSPTAWPYIGPFYPYPQVPLAWRKVCLEWDDGWWFLDFSAHNSSH